MVVALGLSPRELDAIADSEPELYESLVRAIRDKWSTTDELLANLVELTQANMRVLLSLGGVKERDIPKPLRVPRPGDPVKAEKKKATATEFAAWIRRRGGG